MRITKYGLIFMAFVGLCFYAAARMYITVPAATNAIVPLRAALEVLGAKPEQVTIHGWSVLPQSDASEAELDAIVDAALQELSFPNGKVTWKRSASSRHRLVRADISGPQYRGAVMAQVLYPSQQEKKPEVYVVINIDELSPGQETWQPKILKIMADQGATGHISTCLTGSIDGRLEDGQMSLRLNQAFSAINAAVHDTVTDFHYISMSGYSPAVAESLTVNGKKVNVNMAMRYSPTDNRTYCIVGSPVIMNEY